MMVGWIRGLKGHMGRIGRMGMPAGDWFEFGRANSSSIGRGWLRMQGIGDCMGGLPKGKSWENGPVGAGYKPSLAGVFTLLRPGTGALRGLGQQALTSAAIKSGMAVWAGFGPLGKSDGQRRRQVGAPLPVATRRGSRLRQRLAAIAVEAFPVGKGFGGKSADREGGMVGNERW